MPAQSNRLGSFFLPPVFASLILLFGFAPSAQAQVPALPTGLSPNDGAQVATTTQVLLSWAVVPGASSYNVRANNWSNSVIRDPQNNCPNSPHYLCVNGVGTNSIRMPVDPGSSYGFFLHACNAAGCGDVAAANFTVLTAAPPAQTVPPAPTGLSPANTTLAAGTANVTLTWNPVAGATWYAVRANDSTDPNLRAPGNNCGAVPHYLCVNSGNANNSLAVPVTAGHSYYWWVHACNQFGCSDPASNTFSVAAAPPPPVGGNLISNGGFESPATGSYVYFPSIPGWANSGGVAVQRNGSAWGAASAPEGIQTAVLQSVGNLSTTVNVPAAGFYTLSFKAAARGSGGPQTISVSVNGSPVYSLTPGSTSFAPYQTTFNLAAGAQTIALSGVNGGDNSAFVDDVQLTAGAQVSGNATISAMAGTSPITIRTCDHDAGAICSLTWRNKEFIDDYDHGRQLQSASSFDGMGESFNPTEAGAEVPYNGINPSASSSRLRAISASNNVLTTETDMAFWRPVGGRAQSGHILNKQVKIGAFGLAHVIEYLTTFTIPVGEAHSSATFEALTGYMPPEFDQFWTLDVKAGATNLVPLANANSEQGLPIIFSTSDGGWAMGIYSPDSPQPSYSGIGYGRWKYPLSGNIVKWNNVFRFSNPPRINNFRSFVIVGSLDNVTVSMQQLYSIVH